MDADLLLAAGVYREIRRHLLRERPKAEEAAFAYVNRTNSDHCFELIRWEPVPKTGFIYQSLYGLELADEYRVNVIKQAHDLGAALMELHSHPLSAHAAFSPSDQAGFREFVPHIRWRLTKRPYFAAVFAARDFDSLWWLSDSAKPDGAIRLTVDGRTVEPTRATLHEWEKPSEHGAI